MWQPANRGQSPNRGWLLQVGEFSGFCAINCLNAASFPEEPRLLGTNEIISQGRKRKREAPKKGRDSVIQKLSTSGLIVAGDRAGELHVLRVRTTQ